MVEIVNGITGQEPPLGVLKYIWLCMDYIPTTTVAIPMITGRPHSAIPCNGADS